MKQRVVIVGGGLAGLSCATYLHRLKVPFQVLEGSDRFGGRVATDHQEGFSLDVGFQVYLDAYPTAAELLDLEALNLRPFQSGALVHVGGKFRTLADPFRHPAHILPSLAGPLPPADLIRMGSLFLKWKTQDVAHALSGKDLPTRTYLRELGFSLRAIERFWEPFLGGIFLEGDLTTSARMFEFVLTMFSRGRATLPKGGMQAIPDQLVSRLPAASLRKNVRVREVLSTSVTLENGEGLQADHVVDARDPWSVEMDSEEACGTACFYFAAEAPPWKLPWLVLCPEAEHIQTLTDLSLLRPPPRPRHLLSVSARSLSATEAEVRSDLGKMFGAAALDWPLLKSYRIPKALPRQRVGHLNPASRSGKRPDGVYVCGDHMETASIEGALLSGKRVAEHILALSRR